MNTKQLYFGALDKFRERNEQILPHIQLQHGRNERWFVREFALAMNAHLAKTWTPTSLPLYADCEIGYADISVWKHGDQSAWKPEAVFEAKALYSDDFGLGREQGSDLPSRVVEKAAAQLRASRVAADRKIGLFFVVYRSRAADTAALARVVDDARAAIRAHFTSDHQIRMTSLSDLCSVEYGARDEVQTWYTQSWITWGVPIESPA